MGMSQEQKKKFDVEFAVYRKSDSFKNYMEAKAKLEAKQGLEKNQRMGFREAPKKPPCAFALFRKDIMPEITAENEKAKAEGAEKMNMAAIARKVGEKFAQVPAEKKAEYQKKADELKEKYDQELAEFKGDKKYSNFLDLRSKIKLRENRLLRLRDMPKRPKSVFAMFAEDHKSEVPPGKGEGKGRSALKVLFNDFPEEKKEGYKTKEKELLEVFKKELDEFKSGETYKTYQETIAKVKKEFTNEAIKVTTLKFLRGAPKPCPATGFALFAGEKRKRDGPEGGKLSKEAKREFAQKAKEEYFKMPKEAKMEYDVKRGQLQKEYEEACKDAAELNLSVTGSEVVGLVPLKSILQAAEYYIERDNLFILDESQKVHLAVHKLGLSSISPFRPEEKIIEYMLPEDNKDLLYKLSGEVHPECGGPDVRAGGRLCGCCCRCTRLWARSYGGKDDIW